MSDHAADDPVLIAGEYVLGVLDTAEMRAVEARAVQDPVLATEIAQWEDRLAPLTGLIAPVSPPPVLWSRLALAAGIGGRPQTGSPALWQATTLAALAVAAGFAFLAFLPNPPAPATTGTQFVAALAPLSAAAPFLVQARADGTLAITPLTGAAAPSGRAFQLWALPKGATRPVSLGILATGVGVVRPSERPLAETQLLVSDEPSGGSPTGQPTGTVLYGGALTPVSPVTAPGR